MTIDGINVFKKPLEIRIYWDSKFERGLQYAELIFKHFSNEEDISFEYNLNIPTYFINNPDSEFKKIHSKRTICFIFVDDFFIINKNKWNKVLYFLKQEKNHSDICIIPVKFSECSYDFSEELSSLNFIIPEDKTKNDKFLLAVAYSIYLCLFNENYNDKVSIPLFLSHCKRSEGIKICNNIKEYLSNIKSPVRLFFDENDINYGERFDIKIENSIKNSTLVIIHSDGFSSREYCKREVLIAKQYERPIVLIDYLQNGEDRLFPYLGNTKTIKIEKNINYFKLLFEIIKESIRIEFYRQRNTALLSLYNAKKSHYKIIPYPPELLTVSFRKDKKETIIYPNPILGFEEIKILEEQFPNKSFLTPILFIISLKKYTSFLNNLSISFSVSDTENIHTTPDLAFRLKETLINICRYLVACGGNIIYSGNFNYEKFNFLTVLMDQFISYKQWLDNKKGISSDFFEYIYCDSVNKPTNEKLAEISTIGHVTSIEAVKTKFSKELNLSLSLSKLRAYIAKKSNVSIFLAGKINGYSGIMPGVLEEFLYALKYKHAIFLIGAYGGITSEIINLILYKNYKTVLSNSKLINQRKSFYDQYKKYQESEKNNEFDFDKIVKIIKSLKISNLKNGLTKKENLILFKSDDPDLISFLILKGLKKLTK